MNDGRKNLPFTMTEVLPYMPTINIRRNVGNKLIGDCPFCRENGHEKGGKQKLYVFLDGYFKCNKCGEKGGILKLYNGVNGRGDSKAENSEAMKDICSLLNIPVYDKDADAETKARAKKKILEAKMRAAEQEKAAILESRKKKPSCPVKIRDKIYREILELPELELSDKHYESLSQRGLDDNRSEYFEYRTVDDLSWAKTKPFLSETEFYEIKKTDSAYRSLRYDEVAAGVYIATFVQMRGYKLNGVTGFYKFGKYWSFVLYKNSMIIPTRNSKGMIIGLQYRLDEGKTRYLTLSSGKYPEGSVNDLMFHFPLNNAQFGQTKEVYLTEGPLKGDITGSLIQKPTIFLCMLGVTNTQNLDGIFKMFRKNGITKIINTYDMDRILNNHVHDALQILRDKAQKYHIEFEHRYWDEKFAEKKLKELITVAKENNITIKYKGDVKLLNTFQKVSLVASALSKAKITFDSDWNQETKGIDDYTVHLYSSQKK